MPQFTLRERIRILAEGSKYDTCNAAGICRTWGPDGRCISLYKTLITNSCSGDCLYCPNRCGRKTSRASLSKSEIKSITWSLYRKNIIEGLFLSSGIRGDVPSITDHQIEIARELRKEGFNGYIHMRLMPGVSRDKVDEISRYVDKFGINVETTSSSHYSELCPTFDYKVDAIRRMRYTDSIIRRRRSEGKIVGANDTQFVLGAAGETDWEYIRTASFFMDKYSLRRPYFMTFSPVPGTPLSKNPPAKLWREHRLYQATFLLKEYGYKKAEFRQILNDGFLPNQDPKVLLAQDIVLDPNSASESELLRIPGIGPLSAERILRGRPFRSLQELKKIGVATKRAAPYLEINGSSQSRLSKWS